MSIGTYTLIKNEAPWIAACVLRVLPYVDEMVFYDGNSTDGTLEIIEQIALDNPRDNYKIKIFRNQDPIDLKESYVRVFNNCLRSLSTDLAWFLHPDMYCVDPARILSVKDSAALALSTKMRSFAGEPGGQLYEIKGRGAEWKNIDRLRNPDLGAVYHGHYGAHNEGVYPTEIVGDSRHLPVDVSNFPYEVEDSGLEVLHFSDVRTYERRLGRMRTCLANQGNPLSIADYHPRVTLKNGADNIGEKYEFVPAEYPAEMLADRAKYSHLERTLAKV